VVEDIDADAVDLLVRQWVADRAHHDTEDQAPTW
jgi:hypothetical protein